MACATVIDKQTESMCVLLERPWSVCQTADALDRSFFAETFVSSVKTQDSPREKSVFPPLPPRALHPAAMLTPANHYFRFIPRLTQ